MKKKFKLYFIMLIALLITLCSCDFSRKESVYSLPSTSDNFSQEFVDSFCNDYWIYDPQLYYLKMMPYEVRLKYASSNIPEANYDSVLLSPIIGVPTEQFVAVTHYRVPFLLFTSPTCYVYQRYDAPIPMKDYKISSVSIVGSEIILYHFLDHLDFDVLKELSQNHFERLLKSEETSILAEYKFSENSSIISALKDGYDNAILDNILEHHIETKNKPTEPATYYYLLFKFEEAENLVWFVPIVEDTSHNLYYSYSYYDKIKVKNSEGKEYLSYKKVSYLAPISGEIVETIRELEKNDIRQE